MNPDVHAPYIAELESHGDWAALLRYWIGHGLHRPPADAAIRLVRDRRGETWAKLAEFLTAVVEKPYEPRELPSSLRNARWADREAATLLLVALLPRMVLCEFAGRYPVAQQDRMFAFGEQAASVTAKIAAACAEPVLAAFAQMLIARTFHERRQLEAPPAC